MIDITKIEFNKYENNLVPTIIQDENTLQVLMLGFMNKQALEKTLSLKKVTFFSRSKNRLWTKGESSNNFLNLKSISLDCDNDSLLILVTADGPTCHTGEISCFKDNNHNATLFLNTLENIISQRRIDTGNEKSYVQSLTKKGINKIAQKLGEEAVETVIAALNETDELFLNESADLLFHYLILLQEKKYKLKDVVNILQERFKNKK